MNGKSMVGAAARIILAEADSAPACDPRHKLAARGLSVFYDGRPAVEGVNLAVCRGCVTAVIGPSGCGKTTFLMALNRLVEMVPRARVEGRVLLDGVDVLDPKAPVVDVRRRIGYIFQKPNPFPISIYKNVSLALEDHGLADRHQAAGRVEQALRDVGLWEEVKDRLHKPALALSGGQQQRLCLARAIALRPEVLLLDEPCAALDPVSSARVEELIKGLAERYTVLVVTHNLAQARRIAHYTAVFYPREGRGRLLEFGPTDSIFEAPQELETKDYVAGRAG